MWKVLAKKSADENMEGLVFICSSSWFLSFTLVEANTFLQSCSYVNHILQQICEALQEEHPYFYGSLDSETHVIISKSSLGVWGILIRFQWV